MPLQKRILRCPVFINDVGVPFKVVSTGERPKHWRGNALLAQFGFFEGTAANPTPADLSAYNWLRVEVYAMANGGPTGAPLMSEQITSFNDTLALADWQDGSAQHAVFEFEGPETALDLDGAPSAEFWIIVRGLTDAPDADPITFGHSLLTVLEDEGNDAAGPVQPGSIIPGGAAYNGSGNYTLTGLVVGDVYQYILGANDTDITCGADNLAADGFFTAEATSATLTGTPSALVTAVVRHDPFLTVTQGDARYLSGKLIWRGAWSNVTTYAQYNAVSHGGSSWVSKQDSNLNQTPPTLPTESDSWWELLAKKGDTGTTGAAGTSARAGVVWNFDSNTTTNADPGTGDFRLNHATPASATEMAISETDADGGAQEAWLLSWDDSTNTALRGTVVVRKRATPSTFAIYNLTGATVDASGYVRLALTYVTGNGSFTNADPCDVVFLRTGNAGAAGSASNAYSYVAYASDDSGTDFATSPAEGLDFVAFKSSTTPLTPVAGDFAGLWRRYIGAAGSGSGDMILNAVQVVTGPKTYHDNTLLVKSSSGVSRAAFRAALNADREITIPDKSGTLRLAAKTTLAYAASIALDFATDELQEVTLTGALTLTTTNLAAGRRIALMIVGDGSDRALTVPGDWKFTGPVPRKLKANKRGLLILDSFGTTDANVVARWWPEGSNVSYQSASASAAGSTEITAPQGGGIHSTLLTVTDSYGGGSFTHVFYFGTAGAQPGDRVECDLELPASTDPVIEFRNATSGGTLLLSIQSVMLASSMKLAVVFNGTAWVLEPGWAATWHTATGARVLNNVTRESLGTISADLEVDFDRAAIQTGTVSADIDLSTLTGSRSGTGESKCVGLRLTASGARTITLHASIKTSGDPAIALAGGETLVIALESNGSNETDTIAAYLIV